MSNDKITYGTPVAVVRRERLSGRRKQALLNRQSSLERSIRDRTKFMRPGVTGKISVPLTQDGHQYYLLRLDSFPVYGQTGTILVKSFEIEKIQEKTMNNTFENGQRARVTGLNFGCFTAYQLKQVGAFNDGDTARRQALVGKVVEVGAKVLSRNYEFDAYYVFGEGDKTGVPFLARELEAVEAEPIVETPAEVSAETPSTELKNNLEELVLQLLSIFPNDEPADVLDMDSFDADPKDAETVNRVVPALRALLRNHPTEVARRKTRKAEQTQIRREIRDTERLADEAEVRAQANTEQAAQHRARVEELRAKLS